MVADSESQYLLILCVWQEGADALMDEYQDLAKSLPQGNNLEVLAINKQDLLKKFKVPVHQCTTDEINGLCQNIGTSVKDRKVSLFIDECWVTAPLKYSAHLTPVSG